MIKLERIDSYFKENDIVYSDIVLLPPNSEVDTTGLIVYNTGFRRWKLGFRNLANDHQALIPNLIASFDFRERRKRTLVAIYQELSAKTIEQKIDIMTKVIAYWVRENPEMAERLNLGVVGDEVEQ